MRFDATNPEHCAKFEEIRARFPQKWLSGFEMIRILRTCGASVRRFAEYLGKSENYVRQSLGYRRYRTVPLMVIDQLQSYVGRENYEVAFASARDRTLTDMTSSELRSGRTEKLQW